MSKQSLKDFKEQVILLHKNKRLVWEVGQGGFPKEYITVEDSTGTRQIPVSDIQQVKYRKGFIFEKDSIILIGVQVKVLFRGKLHHIKGLKGNYNKVWIDYLDLLVKLYNDKI